MENTDAHWREWGICDPYRGVLFDDKYNRLCLDQNRADFFETGHAYIDWLLQKLGILYPDLPLQTAVDFGCGVGRLSIPLARRFQEVVGVDISPAMLNESRKNCSISGISNVQLVLSDDRVSEVRFGVDLVHSYLVLQHIPVKRGLVIVRHLLERLAPGGACALHVPVDRDPSHVKKLVYFFKHALPALRYPLNLLQGKRINEPLMQINPYPIRAVYDVFESAGLKDVWLLPLAGSHYSVICFGRKAP